MAVYVCVCTVCVAVVVGVKENDLCACLWRDEEEGRWCRALVISVHDSMVGTYNIGRVSLAF